MRVLKKIKPLLIGSIKTADRVIWEMFGLRAMITMIDKRFDISINRLYNIARY